MRIQRTIQKHIEKNFFEGKIIVIYGARQVGKTTLLKTLQEKYKNKEQIYLNCDEPDIRESLIDTSSTELKAQIGNAQIVYIDEAQRVKNIGLSLKLAIDSMPGKQFIVTGSSSFDLANKINEPLTGRKYEFYLYPFSLEELKNHYSLLEHRRLLDKYLSFGLFPDVIGQSQKAEQIVSGLVRGTLYKDVLKYQQLRHAELLEKLLKALAFQIGNEVSYDELALKLRSTKETIKRYVRLLEQSFIIFELPPFSRNLRTELKKMRKIYFYDVGIRNALINAFGPIDIRNDVGSLWENFLIAERIKHLHNNMNFPNTYFWRTWRQEEIDYLEEKNLKLSAYEFKWNPKKKTRVPKAFSDNYKDASFLLINPQNYQDFVGLNS